LSTDRAFGPLEALAFSSVLAAAVAASLVLACGLAIAPGFQASTLGAAALLAAMGTLVVYNLDRLRDLERDRLTAPRRTRFIEANRGRLSTLTAAAGGLCIPLAWRLPEPVWLLCGAVLVLGLLHRRLKRSANWKIAYLTCAWTAVAVGVPTLAAAGTPVDRVAALTAAAIVAPTIAANLIASNLGARPDTAERPRLAQARGLCAFAAGVALLSGGRVWPLLAIPVCEGVALMRLRRDEHYRHVVVDGVIAVGALLSALGIRSLG
jgi:UPF0716 family protein affecting phage T7 exclusion